MLGMSEKQMEFVKDKPAGNGLMKVGGSFVPFINAFPKHTELYRLLSTKPGEGDANAG